MSLFNPCDCGGLRYLPDFMPLLQVKQGKPSLRRLTGSQDGPTVPAVTVALNAPKYCLDNDLNTPEVLI